MCRNSWFYFASWISELGGTEAPLRSEDETNSEPNERILIKTVVSKTDEVRPALARKRRLRSPTTKLTFIFICFLFYFVQVLCRLSTSCQVSRPHLSLLPVWWPRRSVPHRVVCSGSEVSCSRRTFSTGQQVKKNPEIHRSELLLRFLKVSTGRPPCSSSLPPATLATASINTASKFDFLVVKLPRDPERCETRKRKTRNLAFMLLSWKPGSPCLSSSVEESGADVRSSLKVVGRSAIGQ